MEKQHLKKIFTYQRLISQQIQINNKHNTIFESIKDEKSHTHTHTPNKDIPKTVTMTGKTEQRQTLPSSDKIDMTCF